MNVLAFSASPRPNGNSAALLDAFADGLRESGGSLEVINAQHCRIRPCRGCLRCNLIGRCALRNDGWPAMSSKILDADVLVFAAPIYFHHVPAPLKIILDRFRSFIHVRITEQGLVYTPWHAWNKHFVLLLAMGSPSAEDGRPVVELFEYITGVLGPANRLSAVQATGLAVAGQIKMRAGELRSQYAGLGLDPALSEKHRVCNLAFLEAAASLGRNVLKC